jgi:hypothetical protein
LPPLTPGAYCLPSYSCWRTRRITWRRAQHATEQQHNHDTTIVVNWLTYTGAG